MQNFQQNLAKLEAADTQVLGVSMDSPFSNKAWAQQINVTFPLLSDWGGDVTKQYGLYNPKYKAARRINFLIGKDGKILHVTDTMNADTHLAEMKDAVEKVGHKG